LLEFNRKIIFTEEHLKQKVPELEKSLTLVQSLLKKKEQVETSGAVRYILADQIFAKAEIDYSVGTVHLWLGANVMLEYSYEEAVKFLEDKQQRARTELQNTVDDLAYVRDQIVTCEVNMSRLYNWDVRRRRSATADKAAAVKQS
jgi:prefoldin subunit 5